MIDERAFPGLFERHLTTTDNESDGDPSAKLARSTRRGGIWSALGRHQVGAMAATSVDFAVMILLVEAAGVSPVAGTAVGAGLGAVVNFALGRTWVFPGRSGRWATQAVRYAIVSAASACLNALGEHLAHDVGRVQYVVARVLVSLAVSLLWNFPMQRLFVFRDSRSRDDGGAAR